MLAAANSIFGRWDDTKAEENIDFMPTILSRFDCIFIVKDTHDEDRDITMAKHVMNVHVNANNQDEVLWCTKCTADLKLSVNSCCSCFSRETRSALNEIQQIF